MERRVRERLVGALVLVTLVVLLVPAVLKGRDPPPAAEAGPPSRRVVVELEPRDAKPSDEVLVPEPELPQDPPATRVSETLAREAEPSVGVSPPAAEERKAPPAAPPAPPAARDPVESPAWAVQLGAFAGRDRSNQLVAELRKRGYAAFVLEYRATGKVLYRVRVGPEQDRARAEEIALRLRKDGFQPVVARHP